MPCTYCPVVYILPCFAPLASVLGLYALLCGPTLASRPIHLQDQQPQTAKHRPTLLLEKTPLMADRGHFRWLDLWHKKTRAIKTPPCALVDFPQINRKMKSNLLPGCLCAWLHLGRGVSCTFFVLYHALYGHYYGDHSAYCMVKCPDKVWSDSPSRGGWSGTGGWCWGGGGVC